jgi:hypothetical protein
VTYKPGANGNGSQQTAFKTHDVALTLKGKTFTRSGGYTQTGWATSDGGAKVYDLGVSYTGNSAITLYPFWTIAKVQLWAGGPYWSTMNIGAEEPWEYGYYFWWGDTIGYKRANYKWVASDGSSSNFSFSSENTPTYNKDIPTLQSEGWITADNVLAPEHDAAHVQWGGGWRMPTKQELKDLCDNCDWTWTTTNNINGIVVRGRGDYASASIFLPASGYGEETSAGNIGSYGYYLASAPSSDSRFSASLYFTPGAYHTASQGWSYFGIPIRPVQGVAE